MKRTLRGLRVDSGLTRKQVADALGVSEATWINYETGKSLPNAITVVKLVKLFNVQLDDIKFEEAEK